MINIYNDLIMKAVYNSIDVRNQRQILNFAQNLEKITNSIIINQKVCQKINDYSIDTDEMISKFQIWSKKIRFLCSQLSNCAAGPSVVKLFYILNLQRIYYENQKQTKVAAIYLQIYSKLSYFFDVLKSVLDYKQDITTDCNFNNDRFLKIYEKMRLITHKDLVKRQQQTQKLAKLMVINNSAVISQLNYQNIMLRLINFAVSYPRFLIDYEEAELINNAFLCHPKIEILQEIWNLIEKGAIGRLKYINFQYIATNRMMYIPLREESFHQNILLQQNNRIPVRIIHNYEVVFQQDIQNCCTICNNKPNQIIQKIILHLHGGGFISLSSDTTQDYTRKWAKSLKIPVLSVDYSIAPQQKFPKALNEVFLVYKFIISRLKKCSNINPKKIILAGDSAGGNLVCSLMALILKEGITPPYAIFLAYPAVDLRKQFTPSKIYSFNHPILQPSLLNLCLTSYIDEKMHQPSTNPLISPLLLTQAFVNSKSDSQLFPLQWPKTRIMVGNQDPLYDDSLRLCQRMVQANIDVECIIYKGLSHAFLSFEQFYSDSQGTIRDSIMILENLLI